MKIDPNKIQELVAREIPLSSPDELRREENVFFVGGHLPERQTVETLFESHFQCNAALFHLNFGDMDRFANAEMLARAIKKNFNAHLVGRLDYPAPPHLIERAYAAGVDILDIPLPVLAGTGAMDGAGGKERLHAINTARTVFPRWSVISTLMAGEGALGSTMAGIDALLALEVVPLVTLSDKAALHPTDELAKIFTHLNNGWHRKKAVIKPLLPLIYLTTPLVPISSRGMLRGFIDSIEDRRLLAASDLRRVLRVKEVEQSFESSGL